MGKVTVYQYRILNSRRGFGMRKARRWATRKAINRHKSAEILEETATEVDASAVSSNGVTGLDFDPARLSS